MVLLPLHAADKYSQVRLVITVALTSTKVSIGDLAICALGRNVYQEEGDLVVLTDVEARLEGLVISDLLKLTDSIQFSVMDAAR